MREKEGAGALWNRALVSSARESCFRRRTKRLRRILLAEKNHDGILLGS